MRQLDEERVGQQQAGAGAASPKSRRIFPDLMRSSEFGCVREDDEKKEAISKGGVSHHPSRVRSYWFLLAAERWSFNHSRPMIVRIS